MGITYSIEFSRPLPFLRRGLFQNPFDDSSLHTAIRLDNGVFIEKVDRAAER